ILACLQLLLSRAAQFYNADFVTTRREILVLSERRHLDAIGPSRYSNHRNVFRTFRPIGAVKLSKAFAFGRKHPNDHVDPMLIHYELQKLILLELDIEAVTLASFQRPF